MGEEETTSLNSTLTKIVHDRDQRLWNGCEVAVGYDKQEHDEKAARASQSIFLSKSCLAYNSRMPVTVRTGGYHSLEIYKESIATFSIMVGVDMFFQLLHVNWS